MKSSFLSKAVRYIVIWAVVVFTLYPIVYLFLTSIKPASILMDVPPKHFFIPTLKQYVKMFTTASMLGYMMNSSIIAVVSTIAAMLLGTLASYSFVHFKFKGKRPMLFGILLTRMFPPVTTLIPIYLMISRLNLTDTRLALILPYISFQLPLIIWIMNDFILKIPKGIFEAAEIDGCNPGKVLFTMVIPMSSGGLVASGILAFIYNWNELLFATTLTSFNAKTLPVALKAFTESEGAVQWGEVATIGMIILLPIIFFYMFLNKYLVKGMISGAVKG